MGSCVCCTNSYPSCGTFVSRLFVDFRQVGSETLVNSRGVQTVNCGHCLDTQKVTATTGEIYHCYNCVSPERQRELSANEDCHLCGGSRLVSLDNAYEYERCRLCFSEESEIAYGISEQEIVELNTSYWCNSSGYASS